MHEQVSACRGELDVPPSRHERERGASRRDGSGQDGAVHRLLRPPQAQEEGSPAEVITGVCSGPRMLVYKCITSVRQKTENAPPISAYV